MTDLEFNAVVKFLEGAFRTTLSPNEREAYTLLWSDEDGPSLMKRAVAFCKSERAKFGFPKPGDLIEQPPAARDLKALAILAWNDLLEHLDGWDSVQFADRRIHACVVGLGGWTKLADEVNHLGDFEFSQLKRDFEALYVGLPLGTLETAPDHLVGNHEANNSRNPKFAKFTPPVKRIACAYFDDLPAIEGATEAKALTE